MFNAAASLLFVLALGFLVTLAHRRCHHRSLELDAEEDSESEGSFRTDTTIRATTEQGSPGDVGAFASVDSIIADEENGLRPALVQQPHETEYSDMLPVAMEMNKSKKNPENEDSDPNDIAETEGEWANNDATGNTRNE